MALSVTSRGTLDEKLDCMYAVQYIKRVLFHGQSSAAFWKPD